MLKKLITAVAILLTSCSQQPQKASVDQPRALGETGQQTAAPQIFITASGKLYALYGVSSANGNRLYLRVSSDGGDTFDVPTPVTSADASPMLHGEMSPQMLYDRRMQRVYVLYEDQRGDSDTLAVVSASVWGRRFGAPVQVVPKRVPSPNSFAALGTAPNGDVDVAWLDGRIDAHNRAGSFALYIARSRDQGKSFSPPIRLANTVCPCCRPSIAYDQSGTMYIAWRRVEKGNIRNIVVAKSRTWPSFDQPITVSDDRWSINGCPDSGPRLLIQDGRLLVAWYTQGEKNIPEIRLATTDSQAKTFSPYRVISQGVDDPNHPAWIAGASTPTLIWQGRTPGTQNWEHLSAFLTTVQNGSPDPALHIATPAAIADPVGASSSATNTYIVTTQMPSTAVLIRVRTAPM